jgi:hypothetical protein
MPDDYQTGIVVGITPGAGVWQLEIQRSSGAVSSTAWVLVATVLTNGGSTSYTDSLPLDNGIRNYRARHVSDGYTPGTFSTRVSARPARILEYPT